MAVSMVLLAFGAGIGLSTTSAQPYAGASAKALAVISGLYVAITLVASFAAGGYIAGRMRLPPTVEEARKPISGTAPTALPCGRSPSWSAACSPPRASAGC